MDIRYRIFCMAADSVIADPVFLMGSGNAVSDFIAWLDDLVWGPWMLALHCKDLL